jgi:hypothetical protein
MKHTFKSLRKYYVILLGSKCVICNSTENLEIHHKRGILFYSITCKNMSSYHKVRSSYKWYFKELDLSLKQDNLELQCRACHQRLHRNENQTTLERWL